MKGRSNKTKSKPVLILLSIGAVVIVVGIVYLTLLATSSLQPRATKGNTTQDAPPGNQDDMGTTPSPTSYANSSPTPPPVPVSKPVLQKSSGNAPGSSVPAGAVVEFSCEGTANAQCEIVLTDKANSSRIITLPRKTISSNGRGQYFAAWEWTAIKGSWQIVARSSRNGSGAVLSDSQTLEIK